MIVKVSFELSFLYNTLIILYSPFILLYRMMPIVFNYQLTYFYFLKQDNNLFCEAKIYSKY
ncbi:MAG TPA: hypothetical protein DEU03_07900 [Bacillus sp. (in: Bacteria)]|uniref:Uncharacterized protein n=1 Tax=Bacillus cereus TaxID=1396 RepID=A0A9X7B6S1_BACCE|nr:hypothetical protein CON26_30985 [Bacillus cereus]HCF53072.1 hypothetical protein [Bacillus sp. (in: firmicutes)]PEF15260.1 hypothetical protein CON87_30250 [Bacillus cereus]PET05743.1 hypothetical protein CN516_26045 [Bacillus cereus]PEV80917.1 hypothetical protein CN433_26585 [Bacillus cereus]